MTIQVIKPGPKRTATPTGTPAKSTTKKIELINC
jgi:hypothetical protein